MAPRSSAVQFPIGTQLEHQFSSSEQSRDDEPGTEGVRIKNTFIHLERTPSMDSDDDCVLPTKSVSAPSIKTQESSASFFADSPLACEPASVRQRAASSCLKTPKSEASKTPKCLRFDPAPSFFGGAVGLRAGSEHEQESCEEGETVSQCSMSNRPSEGSQCSLDSLSYTVRNTFIHVTSSAGSTADDEEDDQPMNMTRSLSAPATAALADAIRVSMDFFTGGFPATPTTPVNICLDSLMSDMPSSRMEFAPGVPAKSPKAAPATAGPPHLPSASFFSVAAPGTGKSSAGSRSFDSSSCNFRVKNTFVHIDVDAECDAADKRTPMGFMLPVKSISQPALLSDFAEDTPTAAPPMASTGLPSVGAALHASGQCKPCAWFWKPESCQWGAECKHCHMCPLGELRRRKKERQSEAKELKRAAAAAAAAALQVLA